MPGDLLFTEKNFNRQRIFRGMYLWLSLEAAEDLLTDSGYKFGRGGHYDTSVRVRAEFISYDLEEAIKALEELSALLEELSAKDLLLRVCPVAEFIG